MAKINRVNENDLFGHKITSIDPSALYALIFDIDYDDAEWLAENPPHLKYDWKIVKSELTSSDMEDGGGDYTIVLKHLPTGRFYETSYTDWDMGNTEFDEELGKVITDEEGGRCDLNCGLTEVKPKQITTTIYERI